jgi:translation initiation factor 5B
LKIEIFQSNIIYRIMEEYRGWCFKKKEREVAEKLERVARPCQVKILKGFVFRVSNPAIFGVEVQKGLLKSGVTVKKKDGKIIGRIKEVQKEGQVVKEAKAGEKVAISMEEPTVGRQIEEGDVLIAVLNDEDKKTLIQIFDKLTEGEKEMLKE